MDGWFKKRHRRRFFRKDLQGRVLLKPKHISTTQIFSNGVNYTPEYVEAKFQLLVSTFKRNAENISDYQPLMNTLAFEFSEAFHYLFELLSALTRGDSIQTKLNLWAKRANFSAGVDISGVGMNTVTYKFLSLINEKFVITFQQMISVVENSSSESLHVVEKPDFIEYEQQLKALAQEKSQRVPMVQFIYSLKLAMDYLFDIFHDYQLDHRKVTDSRFWNPYKINLSASGISLRLRKQYSKFESMDVYMNIAGHSFKFEGKVVHLFDCQDGMETVAINFEFPDGKLQDKLLGLIQVAEIDECIGVKR